MLNRIYSEFQNYPNWDFLAFESFIDSVSDQGDVLKRVKSHLAPGGRLLIDLRLPDLTCRAYWTTLGHSRGVGISGNIRIAGERFDKELLAKLISNANLHKTFARLNMVKKKKNFP